MTDAPIPRDPDVPVPPCDHVVWDTTVTPPVCAVCGEPIERRSEL